MNTLGTICTTTDGNIGTYRSLVSVDGAGQDYGFHERSSRDSRLFLGKLLSCLAGLVARIVMVLLAWLFSFGFSLSAI
jgi:hypothetical protein